MPCQTIYTVSALTLLRAHEEPEYAAVLERADLITADGIGAVWAIQRLTGQRPERVTGVDLAVTLARVCAAEEQSVFLLGGKPGVAAEAAARLQDRLPGLRIAGARHGFWRPGEEAEVVAEINRARPGLLLVGIGQPAQEFFLDKVGRGLAARVALGVGGSLDVLAGRLRRAPRWMQRAGLEWLWRWRQEPWRLRRILRLPRFIWVVLRTPRKERRQSEQ